MKRIPCAVFLCLIVFLAGCGSSEQAAWSCSVTAGEDSDIVYSGQKIASQTGGFTLHNKNDFKITVCLLNGEDENVLNMEPSNIKVFDGATENYKGTVIHECS